MKKKILIDGRCIGGEGQGMLTYIVGLYSSMNILYSDQYEFYFAGYHYEEMQQNFPWIKRTHFVQLNTKSKWLLFVKVFPSIIKEYGIDYAHFQYVTPFIKKCKTIVTTHDVLFLDFPEAFPWLYRMQRKLLFLFSLVRSEIRLTVSNYSRKQIAKHFGIAVDTLAITPNAVKEPFLESYKKDEVQLEVYHKLGIKNYLLYVSRIEKRKNHVELLEAYEALNLADQGVQLVIVGNDTLGEEEVADYIKQMQKKYPSQVHWLKGLSDMDLIRVYQGARLFVYPSKAEGFGIPPIEAAALGINTLCANNTAMQDFTFLKDNLYAEKQGELHRALLDNIHQPPPESVLESIATKVKQQYSWNSAAMVLHAELLRA